MALVTLLIAQKVDERAFWYGYGTCSIKPGSGCQATAISGDPDSAHPAPVGTAEIFSRFFEYFHRPLKGL